MSIFTRAYADLKAWFAADPTAQTVVVELTAAEHALLQKFHPLWNQILSTVGTQGIRIVEDALTGVMATIASGGNLGAGISAAATAALSQIESDAKADAKNAVYGLLAASVASLPSTSAPAPVEPAQVA